MEKLRNHIKRNCNNYILFFFLLSIFVDNINGFILQKIGSNSISFGQILRFLFIFFFCVINLLLLSKDEILYIIKKYYYVCIFFFFPIVYYYQHQSFFGIIDDYLYIFKLIYFFLIVYSIKLYFRKGILKKNTLIKVVKLYIWLAPLSIILPYFLGMGFESYANSGYRGFYFANNEINVVLVFTYIYSIDILLEEFNFNSVINYIINLVALLMIGSKTSLIIILIMFIIYFWKYRNKMFTNKKIILYIISSITFLAFFKSFIIKIFNRFKYFYDMLVTNGDGTILTFLLSNRDKRIAPAIKNNIVENSFFIINIFFGVGHYQQTYGKDMNSLMELDFVDTFLWYVIVVAIYILFQYIYIFYKSKDKKDIFVYQLSYIVILMFSLVAGHVWYSPLSATIFSLIACFLLIPNNEEEV